jgi:hypothetical protein
MIATGAYILVSTEGQYVDTITHKSLTLHMVTGYNPTHNIRYSGVVTSLPIIQPFDETVEDGKKVQYKIDPIIKEGDKAYFRYVNNDGDVNIIDNGKRVVRVPYRDVICIVRDGQIIPVGEWMLGEKVMEQKSSVRGLEVDFNSKYYEDRAIVKYFSNFVDQEPIVSVGDTVQGNNINFENEIEEQFFYCFRPFQLNAVLEYGCNI